MNRIKLPIVAFVMTPLCRSTSHRYLAVFSDKSPNAHQMRLCSVLDSVSYPPFCHPCTASLFHSPYIDDVAFRNVQIFNLIIIKMLWSSCVGWAISRKLCNLSKHMTSCRRSLKPSEIQRMPPSHAAWTPAHSIETSKRDAITLFLKCSPTLFGSS